jgi:hypothetical protein
VETQFRDICLDNGTCAEERDETRIDCAEQGLACFEGLCEGPPPECTVDEDCPQPEHLWECDGNIAVRATAATGCIDGQCEINTGETRTDCDATSQLCVVGECTDIMSSENVEINDEHRACETAEDCRGFYSGCSSCPDACGAVNEAYVEVYAGALDCSNYMGPVCDFDCHPDNGLTEVACENNLCVLNTL